METLFITALGLATLSAFIKLILTLIEGVKLQKNYKQISNTNEN